MQEILPSRKVVKLMFVTMEEDVLKEDGVYGANALEDSKDRGASKRQDHFGARDGLGILHLSFARTPTCRLSS